jgi:AcrR family transcriptional regulator
MRDGSETREKIERTALGLFVAHGIAETSMRDIAKAGKVSLGAIYNHFPSKEELAWQLFARIFSEVGNELYRRAHAERSFQRKLRAMIAYVFDMADSEPQSITYLFVVRQQFVDKLPSGIGNPYLAFRTVIADGMRQGLIEKQDANLATTMVIGVVNQLVDSKVLGHTKQSMAALTEIATKACLRMLGA